MLASSFVSPEAAQTLLRFFAFCIESSANSASPPAEALENPAWIGLLDLAVSPRMLRVGVTRLNDAETAEAALKYYLGKPERGENDAAKIEILSSFLCRTLFAGESIQTQFCSFLGGITGNAAGAAEASGEPCAAFLAELQALRQEFEQVPSLEALMACGLVARGREAKRRNQHLLYGHEVLAAVAAYNVALTHRFNALLQREAEQARQAAARLTAAAEAASTASLNSDVDVLDQRDVLDAPDPITRFEAIVRKLTARAASVAPSSETAPGTGPQVAREFTFTSAVDQAESDLLRDVMTQVRNHVRSASADGVHLLRHARGESTLSPAEVDAFRADYLNEQSFRGSYAATLCDLCAVRIRLESEVANFLARKDSEYLWQAPAGSLRYLLTASRRAVSNALPLLKTAMTRGLAEKSEALQSVLETLGGLQRQAEEELRAKDAMGPEVVSHAHPGKNPLR